MTLKLNTLLATHQSLRQLTGKLQQLQKLQVMLEKALPSSLKSNCHVMNYDQGLLIVSTSNGSLAAKLRQLIPELQKQLYLQGCKITEIQIKVQVNTHTPYQQAPASLGLKSRNQLQKFSDTLNESPLKHALMRLMEKARIRK